MPDAKELAAIERITPLLEQAKSILSDPTVQALRQRDAFHEAWDTAVHDLLKNMQEIRRDIAEIRRSVTAACAGGENDTQKILDAIHQSTTDIIRNVWQAEPPAPKPEPPKRYGARRKK